jgi:hypothetical protein
LTDEASADLIPPVKRLLVIVMILAGQDPPGQGSELGEEP